MALVAKKHKYFPGICGAAGGSAFIPPTTDLCFHKNSIILYSLSKSAASAVLRLLTVVIAMVFTVGIKSLSVTTMFFE